MISCVVDKSSYASIEGNPTPIDENLWPDIMSTNQAIIYEMQVRDYSIDANSGIVNKGKYIGLAESGTKHSSGDATGLDYLKEIEILMYICCHPSTMT